MDSANKAKNTLYKVEILIETGSEILKRQAIFTVLKHHCLSLQISPPHNAMLVLANAALVLNFLHF